MLLCGRSGCGKTTLTRLVNGLIPYFYPGEVTGTTYIDGKDIQDYPMYEVSEHVGSVFQNPRSQFFNVDTDSEISFGMENLSYPREKMKERISKTVADLDIAHLTGRSIFELSGGEKQKVAFASMQIRYLSYLTAYYKAVGNMKNCCRPCRFIKPCGKKKNPLKTGSWHNERQEQTSCVRGGPSGNHEQLKALGNLK